MCICVCEGWAEEGEKEKKRKRMEGEMKGEKTLNCSVSKSLRRSWQREEESDKRTIFISS